MGDSVAALEFIAEGIEWHIVGDRTIDGNVTIKETVSYTHLTLPTILRV